MARRTGLGVRTVSPSIPAKISGSSASAITSSAENSHAPAAQRPDRSHRAGHGHHDRAERPSIEPGPVPKPDPGNGTGFAGYGTMVMPRLRLAGKVILHFRPEVWSQ
jgi:hypothetical protein